MAIIEDYVSFETAKLLKEKGFDEATNRYYNAQYDQIRTVSDTFMWHWNNEEFMKRVLMEGAIAIPTLQMAMKWLREVHHIFLSIQQHIDMSYVWYAYVDGAAKGCDRESHNNTYEEACETAIKYCLENLRERYTCWLKNR